MLKCCQTRLVGLADKDIRPASSVILQIALRTEQKFNYVFFILEYISFFLKSRHFSADFGLDYPGNRFLGELLLLVLIHIVSLFKIYIGSPQVIEENRETKRKMLPKWDCFAF